MKAELIRNQKTRDMIGKKLKMNGGFYGNIC